MILKTWNNSYLVVAFVIFLGNESLGNNKDSLLSQEVHLQIDNDVFLFQNIDQYYSSGIFLNYSRLIKKGKLGFNPILKNKNFEKSVVTYSFRHHLFTPRDVGVDYEPIIDRPYAGWADLGLTIGNFYKHAKLEFSGFMGWLGPSIKSEEIQVFWHETLKVRTPIGWGDFQIDDMASVQMRVDYKKRILGNEAIDFIGELVLNYGTIMRNIQGAITIRFGLLQSISSSQYTRGVLGQKRVKISSIPKARRVQEAYIFYNHRWIRSFYNATLEGNLVGRSDRFDGLSESILSQSIWGLASSGRYFDWKVALNLLSPELIGTEKHIYITISLAHRI